METALLPYSLNTFSCMNMGAIPFYNFLERRTPAQRGVVLAVPRNYPTSSGRKLVFTATEWMAICQARRERSYN